MSNPDTELLFPLRVIPVLRDLREEKWRVLINQLTDEHVELGDQLAFVYMMVRVAGCVTCNADAYRAMRGCSQCAVHAVKRFRGTDAELLDLFKKSYQKVNGYLVKTGSR